MKKKDPEDIEGFEDPTVTISSNDDNGNTGDKKKKMGGGFQSFGLGFEVLKGVLKRGYKIPTPIQRKVSVVFRRCTKRSVKDLRLFVY